MGGAQCGLSPRGEALLLLLVACPACLVLLEGVTGLPRLIVEFLWLRARGKRIRLLLPFCYAPYWAMRPPNHHLILTDERLLVCRNALGSVIDVPVQAIEVVEYCEWHSWYREASAIVHSRRSDGSHQEEAALTFGGQAADVVRQLGQVGLPVRGV